MCSDDYQWVFLYNHQRLTEIQLNCPVACGLCELPPGQDDGSVVCEDNINFRGPAGARCTFYQDYDCR